MLVFQDEVHFNIETTVTSQWYPKGSRPRIKSYPGRKSIAYSGFVMPDTGKLFVAKPGWFNYESTIKSIRDYISCVKIEKGKHIHLVMDNASWHKKAKKMIETKEEYSDIQEVLTIEPMPPYSPDLNPIEQVWRMTRRNKTHNKYWSGLPKLIETLDSWFSTFSQENNELKTLCSFDWDKMESG